jgi:beta-lactamase class A
VALASWEEFDRRWSALAPRATFLAAEVVDGACEPVHALNPDERLAIGSAFKLYILGELADQIRAGEARWDEPLAIRDAWKATFSAPMSWLKQGEERTLREFAEQMISISDNTATDHLLFHLGRENVEAIQAEMGHEAPEVNIPMFSTEEVFQLKLSAPEELVEEYLAADVEERRRLLETEVAELPLNPGLAGWWRSPIRIDTIEWFASAEELCRAMATLDAWSQEPGLEPITAILAINPGLPFDPSAWEYVGFKGGSEIGVLNLTWLLRHVDGGTYVMTATLNDPEAPIDEDAAIGLIQAAAQLLAASVSE